MKEEAQMGKGEMAATFTHLFNQTVQEFHRTNLVSTHLHTCGSFEVKTNSEAERNRHSGEDPSGMGTH